MGVEVVGLSELVAGLAHAADRLGPDAMGKQADAVAEQIVAESHPPRRTGYLAAHTAVARVDDTTIGIVNTAAYAATIHNGSQSRHIAAQPWLTDALTQHADQIQNQYTQYATSVLDGIE